MTDKNKSIKKVPNKGESNVPHLRFPGFEGEWEVKKLGEIAKFSKGKGISKSDISEDGSLECVRYGELYTFYDEVIDYIQSKTNLSSKDLVLSEANDVIIPASGESSIDIATASCVTKSGVALGGDLNIIKTSHNGIFLSYYLNSKKKLDIAQLSQGISVVHLYSTQLASLSLNLPSIEEQNKIATFLSEISSRIELSMKTISELEKLRRQIEVDLLSQKIKFKNEIGNNYPDWKRIKIEEICEKQSSNISANKIEDNFGEFPIYGATGFLKNIDFYEIESDYIAIIKDGAGVGRLLLCNGKSSVLGTLDIIKPNNVNLYFLYCLLSNIDFNKYIIGSTIPHIYFKDYRNEYCMIPSLEEQTKIADFLSKISEKIETEMKILELLEQQKKYFLQNLFI